MSFTGPAIDDLEILDELPRDLASCLKSTNGFIKYGGGLHIRGATSVPAWHSLRAIWKNPESHLHKYRNVRSDDVPFGQDALGDQFLLREDVVVKLYGETGTLESLGVNLLEFLERSDRDPIGYLELQPLEAFRRAGGELLPGQLLSVYPPFCTKESKDGVHYQAISVDDRLGFLAQLAAQIQEVPDGTRVRFEVD